MLNKKIIALFLSALGTAAGAAEPGPFYMGTGASVRNDYVTRCIGCDSHSSSGGQVYAGYEFDPSTPFAGSMLVSAIEITGFTAGRSRGGDVDSISLKGASAVYKLSLRDSGRLSANARLGVSYADASHHARGPLGHSYTTSGYAVTGGLGVSYAIDQRWSLNADVDRIEAPHDSILKHVNMFTMGPSYRF